LVVQWHEGGGIGREGGEGCRGRRGLKRTRSSWQCSDARMEGVYVRGREVRKRGLKLRFLRKD
jgi:hypothetical protein